MAVVRLAPSTFGRPNLQIVWSFYKIGELKPNVIVTLVAEPAGCVCVYIYVCVDVHVHLA